MKKLFLILPLMFTLTSCKNATKVTHQDEIIDKYSQQTLDNTATWFLETPQMKRVYFFKLKEYGEREVGKYDYDRYKIGDIYTWEEHVYN